MGRVWWISASPFLDMGSSVKDETIANHQYHRFTQHQSVWIMIPMYLIWLDLFTIPEECNESTKWDSLHENVPGKLVPR